MKKIVLSADSTCDIGEKLQNKYNVQFFCFHIQIADDSYLDGVEIQPEELYAAWRQRGILPKTAAITPEEYHDFFSRWVQDGYEVVHLNLGSAISSAHQNCCITAKELGNVYPIDSANLSTGFGNLVIKAGEMIAAGYSAKQVQQKIIGMRDKVHASFVLDTLEFMRAGGRCSAVTAIGANFLKLKPCIEVNNHEGGSMAVGKKYRGSMEKVLVEYVRDKLSGQNDLDLDRIFITHSGSPESDIQLVKQEIEKYADFKETHITQASGTISAHCGPRTLGILYMTK